MSLTDAAPADVRQFPHDGSRRRVTSKGTPRHHFRYDPDKWQLAMAKAQRLGTNMSALITGWIDEWIEGEDEPDEDP
jgi:hypothetical protein